MSPYSLLITFFYSTLRIRVIAQIEEVMSDSAAADLRNVGHRALVVVRFDATPHVLDKWARESFLHHLIERVALIHQQKQHLVHVGIRESEFAFVSLPRPQV